MYEGSLSLFYLNLSAIHSGHLCLFADAEWVDFSEGWSLHCEGKVFPILLDHYYRFNFLTHFHNHCRRTWKKRVASCINRQINPFNFIITSPTSFRNSSRFSSKYTFQVPVKSMPAGCVAGLRTFVVLVVIIPSPTLLVGMLGTSNSLLFGLKFPVRGTIGWLFCLFRSPYSQNVLTYLKVMYCIVVLKDSQVPFVHWIYLLYWLL